MKENWIKAAAASDVPEDGTLLVNLGAEPVCLYNLSGKIFATHDTCTHGQERLADGFIEGEEIERPLYDEGIAATPVFRSRVFRHSMIYVRDGGKIARPEELKGKRIGVPEWAQTAVIYARGYLAHQVGVPLDSVDWVQAGVNEAGRGEKVKLKLPAGVRLRPEPARSPNDMLLAGDLDCVLSARPPRGLGKGIRRLFSDYEAAEEAYFKETGVFPIMHVIVIRGDVLPRHPC